LLQKREPTEVEQVSPKWPIQGRELKEVALRSGALEQERTAGAIVDPPGQNT